MCYHSPGWSGIIIVNIDNDDPFKLDAAIERSAASGGGGSAAAFACVEKLRRQFFSKIATNSQTLLPLLLERTFWEDNRHIQVTWEHFQLAPWPYCAIFIFMHPFGIKRGRHFIFFCKNKLSRYSYPTPCVLGVDWCAVSAWHDRQQAHSFR